eukprot:m.81963 g.81963  ORF g.81963 m.81963 type:complete len:535 (+) comp12663_c0_seq4:34-1638(+)
MMMRSRKQQTLESIGSLAWWGFSPALDFVEVVDANTLQSTPRDDGGDDGRGEVEPLRFLFMGAGDARHILKTLANIVNTRPIYIYTVEPALDIIAKQLLLVDLALKPLEVVGLQERTSRYMELFGNAFVRPTTDQYVKQQATKLIDLVTDPSKLKQDLPWYHLKFLKFRDVDDLEAAFDFWRASPQKRAFPMGALWEARLRQHYEQRFDARRNLVDWDYSMKLVDVAPIVNMREFAHWREVGVAFELDDADYSVSNRTFGSMERVKKKGQVKEVRGFWGDIITGPYIAHGTSSSNQSLFEKRNDHYIKLATDVTKYNLLALMHQIATGTPYDGHEVDEAEAPAAPKIQEVPGTEGEGDEDGDEDGDGDGSVNSFSEGGCGSGSDKVQVVNVLSRVNFKLAPLPTDASSKLLRKDRFANFFDAVYLSTSYAHHLPDLATTIAKVGAPIVVETAKYVLSLNKEQVEAYVGKVTGFAKNANLRQCGVGNASSDHLVFQRTHDSVPVEADLSVPTSTPPKACDQEAETEAVASHGAAS